MNNQNSTPSTDTEAHLGELPPDDATVGFYSSTDHSNAGQEVKVTTPKALDDGLIAPAQEYEGQVDFNRAWDTEFTEELHGKFKPYALPSLSRAHTAFAEKSMPAVAIGDDANSRKWLDTINSGLKGTTFNGMYQDEVRTSGTPFSNDVTFRGRQLNPRHVAWPALGSEKLEGGRAVIRTMSSLGLTSLSQTPLWASGIWVTFRAAGDLDFVRFNQTLTDMYYTLGRATYGLAFSALTGLTTSKIIDFLLEFILESSVDIDLQLLNPRDAKHPLRDLIRTEDIPVMIAGFLESRFPKGYPYERACLDNPAVNNCVIKRAFNLKEMIISRTSTLSDNHRMFMSDRRPRIHSVEQVKEYQNTLINNAPKRYNVGKYNGYDIYITLKSVNIASVEESTNSWVGSLVAKMEDIVSESTDIKKRNNILAQMSLASIARQYTHFISQIEIGQAVMDEKEAIEEQITAFSSHDSIRNKIMESVVDHLEKNVISIVAVPVLRCNKCQKDNSAEATKPNFTNAVPLDMVELFFALSLQILMTLKDR